MTFLLRFFPALQPYALAIKLAFILALFIAGFGLGWHFNGNEQAADQLAAQKQEVKRGNAVNSQDSANAQQHESVRVKIEYRDRIVIQQVASAAADYKSCKLKPDDLALLNKAIGGGDVRDAR